jgi:hypothetical protein
LSSEEYKRGQCGGAVRVNPNHTPHSSTVASLDRSTLLCLILPASMAPSSPDMVLLLLVTSSGAEPYPLALVPRRRSPSSSATHRLGPAVKSHDPGARPLPNWVAKWANQWSIWLPHKLLRSNGVPEAKGFASLEGSADGGTTRDSVSEVGGVVAVCGVSDPWGRPHGPMEMRTIRRITGASTGMVTTVMRHSSSSSYPSSSP